VDDRSGFMRRLYQSVGERMLHTMSDTDTAKIEGGLLGLLIGDALGVPYEFHAPEDLPSRELLELTPPAGFRRAHQSVAPGTWSDDGAQALCLLASLLERGRFDLDDFAARLLRWFERGYLAVDGRVFDVGIQTQASLARLSDGVNAKQAGSSGERDNGNGSLMRVLPLALWHRGSDQELIRDAMHSSLPTHAHVRSQLYCAAYCMWARSLLEGALDVRQAWKVAIHTTEVQAAALQVGAQEFLALELRRPPGGSGSGYVVDCLHSARLALEEPSYEGVVKAAIALGHDTDTTAAVAGGIAGIVFGTDGIPVRWRQGLRGRELLDPLLDALLDVHA
jgi:ADP-ribosyl-[dinitrogen reductase] hydrolase